MLHGAASEPLTKTRHDRGIFGRDGKIFTANGAITKKAPELNCFGIVARAAYVWELGFRGKVPTLPSIRALRGDQSLECAVSPGIGSGFRATGDDNTRLVVGSP